MNDKINIEEKSADLIRFVTGYHKLKKQRGFKNQSDLFPNFKVLQTRLQIPNRNDLVALLRTLENKGEIERYFAKYYLPGTRKEPKSEKTIKKVHKTFKLPFLKSRVFYFKILIFICFLFFFYIAFDNLLKGFSQTKTGLKLIIYSVSFLFASITFADISVYYWLKKSRLYLLFAFIALSFFLCNSLIILKGQYQGFIESFQTIELNNQGKNNLSLLSLQQEEKQLNKQVDNYNTQLDRLNELVKIKSTLKLEKEIYNLIFIFIPKTNNDLKKNKEDQKTLLNNQETKITTHEKTWLDSFWLASFEFIMVGLCAELIATISLALLFFMKNEDV